MSEDVPGYQVTVPEWHWTDDVGTPVRCLVVVFSFAMANQALVIWAAEWGWSQWLYLPVMLVVWVFSPVLAMQWVGCFRQPQRKDGG